MAKSVVGQKHMTENSTQWRLREECGDFSHVNFASAVGVTEELKVRSE